MSFLGANVWALGTQDCSSRRCPVLLHSTDNGHHWHTLPLPNVRVAAPLSVRICSTPCIDAVRFATPQIGYLSGGASLDQAANEALFITRDGGRTWHRQPGGADALEPGDGNVIRLLGRDHCSLSCEYDVQTAPVSASHWRTTRLAGPYRDPRGGTLLRSGHLAFVQTFGNQAGGGDARAVLWTSADDGVSWANRSEPCPQSEQPGSAFDGEVDGSAVSAAPDGALTILCQARGNPAKTLLITSTDGGSSFTPLGSMPVYFTYRIAALTSRVLLDIAGPDNVANVGPQHLERSTDGGRTWSVVASAGQSSFTYLAASSSRIVHLIGQDGRELLTSTSAGRTWIKVLFPS